jgi:hypothetical protein
MKISFDFSRALNPKEQVAFEARQARLDGHFGVSVTNAVATITDRVGAPGKLANGSLRLRPSFSYLATPISEHHVSDRRAPRRELRPSATRISSSQGAALRLYVTALAVAQMWVRPGTQPVLDMPLVAFNNELGWTDLVATKATESGRGRHSASVRDKKGRTVRNALDTLEEARLVRLPGTPGKRGRHEGFTLLHEGGHQLSGDLVPYRVPRKTDEAFALPLGFLTNGWIHVLADSEIALLLMVACGRGRLAPLGADHDIRPGEVAIPADIRLRHYGIHRDPFSTAHKTLQWFGLLDVREVARHDDGRAEDGDQRLHRLKLSPAGFEAEALSTVREEIRHQLGRRAT